MKKVRVCYTDIFICLGLYTNIRFFYYINTSEIPTELSRENFISSLVRYRVDHSKIKFISTRGHVISSIYYINTSEIPSELSRENFISSHVKITCYLHM